MQPKISSHPELVQKFPLEVKRLFKVFDGEIRLVGGSVRDLLIGKKVHDFDFATKFLPEEITEILEKNKIRAIPTGAKFGTITAVLNRKNFEITTLRKDNETDGRHCKPHFVDDYFLDASRRDFTVNALYADATGQVYDYFGGIADLKDKKVRFIGDASARISEDFLRILRFFRFSCEYAAKLDSEALEACVSQKENLKKLSKERIRQEFLKLLSSSKKENLITILKVLESTKIADEIFSQKLDIKALERLSENDLNLRIAALFLHENFDLKIFSKEICATNLEKKYLTFMSQKHDLSDLQQLLAFEEKELVRDYYLLHQNPVLKKDLQLIENFSAPKFPLDGKDAMALGFKKEKVGEALNSAKKFWAKNDFKPNKSALIKFLQN